mmetsp:Transcript_79577/g.230117  ORF Transcript_79577/g.230117 Transcript_79577/m.230117 type:complete len:282 (-) Transcript_79577:206-1051(-)
MIPWTMPSLGSTTASLRPSHMPASPQPVRTTGTHRISRTCSFRRHHRIKHHGRPPQQSRGERSRSPQGRGRAPRQRRISARRPIAEAEVCRPRSDFSPRRRSAARLRLSLRCPASWQATHSWARRCSAFRTMMMRPGLRSSPQSQRTQRGLRGAVPPWVLPRSGAPAHLPRRARVPRPGRLRRGHAAQVPHRRPPRRRAASSPHGRRSDPGPRSPHRRRRRAGVEGMARGLPLPPLRSSKRRGGGALQPTLRQVWPLVQPQPHGGGAPGLRTQQPRQRTRR